MRKSGHDSFLGNEIRVVGKVRSSSLVHLRMQCFLDDFFRSSSFPERSRVKTLVRKFSTVLM